MFEYSLLLVFPAAMALAAMLDLFTMTIPNRISLFLLGSFFFVAPITGMGWEQFCIHLLVFVGVLIVGIALFAFGVVGGGDAKLLAAASLWIGYNDLFLYVTTAAIFGAFLSFALIGYRTILPPSWLLTQDWAMRLHRKGEGVPYGIALCLGALWVFPSTGWFLSVAV